MIGKQTSILDSDDPGPSMTKKALVAGATFALLTMTFLVACGNKGTDPSKTVGTTAAAAPAASAGNAAATAPGGTRIARDDQNPELYFHAASPEEGMKKVVAELTDPPLVPPPTGRTEPAHVLVELEVIEREMRMANGVTYVFWTYGGVVPGKFIRVREGDFVEFHFKNHPNNKLPHNIDLHAVTGPGGGAASSFAPPGHEVKFEFSALNSGLYIYHCATAPVGMHVANGMYGLIYVEPRVPLAPVDHEFYIVQGDFYTKGDFGASGKQPFDMRKALDENPTYVVFNGSVGSMTGDKALTAKVGDKIRLYVGNGGPNLVSSFHVIGEIFDNVYFEGGTTLSHNIQTTLVPAGGSSIVEFVVEVPGNLILADHSIFRTFNKGALGIITVSGDPQPRIYSGKLEDQVLMPEGSAIQEIGEAPAPPAPMTFDQKMTEGARLYQVNCAACHQANGEGIAAAFPPLANSDYMATDATRTVRSIVKGVTGKITVNGTEYDGVMPSMALSDIDIAAIATFVDNSWGNKLGEVSVENVQAVRSE